MKELKKILQSFYQERFLIRDFYEGLLVAWMIAPDQRLWKLSWSENMQQNYLFKSAFMSCRFFYVNEPFTRISFQICIILKGTQAWNILFIVFVNIFRRWLRLPIYIELIECNRNLGLQDTQDIKNGNWRVDEKMLQSSVPEKPNNL